MATGQVKPNQDNKPELRTQRKKLRKGQGRGQSIAGRGQPFEGCRLFTLLFSLSACGTDPDEPTVNTADSSTVPAPTEPGGSASVAPSVQGSMVPQQTASAPTASAPLGPTAEPTVSPPVSANGGSGGAIGSDGGSGGAPAGGAPAGGAPAGGGSGDTNGFGGGANGGTSGLNAGGSAGAPVEEEFDASFLELAELIEERCGSLCHGGQVGQEHLADFSTANLGSFYDRLTTPLTTDLCYNELPVTPGSPESSLLLQVVQGPSETPCVLPHMPAGCEQDDSCLVADEMAIIESWIAAGAPRN